MQMLEERISELEERKTGIDASDGERKLEERKTGIDEEVAALVHKE